VTVRVAGEVETDGDGKMWLKPGSTAALWATDAGGTVLAGWEDDETGEFIRGEVAFVTPATRRSYTAVFGKPWTYANSKLSNGDWEFAVTDNKIYACSRAPADSLLNLATPMYKKDGSVYRLTGIGRGSTESNKIVISSNLCTTVRLFLPEGVQINTSAFNADYSAGVRGNLSMPRDVVVRGSAFQECRALTNLFFEGGADGGQTMTEYGTFDNCRNLKRVGTLPRSTGSLARHAFYRCGFKSIELPGVTNLSVEAFYRVPLTNVVFGTNAVTFNAYKGVYGNTLFSGAAADCAFRFPGKAPVLVCTGTNTAEGLSRPFTGGIRNSDGETVNSAMFGENSGVRFYGSWRTDPEGWRRVRETIGALVPDGLTLPALEPSAGDRGVKGVFYWSHGAAAPYQGWLIDAAMPNEPPPRGTSFLFR